jgi:hypothetical protein
LIFLTEYPAVTEAALVSLMRREFVTSARNLILERGFKKIITIKEMGYIDTLGTDDYVIINKVA